MRRQHPWLLWLALALLLMLGALATLQYRWVGEVSQAGRHRLATTLHSRAQQFTEEFDREIARVFFWLQVEPTEIDSDDWARYAERYERWLAGAAHPRLVREVWLFAPNVPPRRFDVASRRFVETPVAGALASFWSDAQKEFAEARPAHTPSSWLHAIRDDIPAIVVPVPRLVAFAADQRMRIETLKSLAPRGYTVIVLDEPYITRGLLPELATRAFGASGGSDYHVAVTSRRSNREVFSFGPPVSQTSGKPDIELGLFDVRLDTVADLRVAALGSAKEDNVPPLPFVIAGRKAEGTPLAETRRFTFSVIQRHAAEQAEHAGQDGAASSASRFAVPGPQWTLQVRHRAGSLEAAVASTRRRNLALSGGIFVLFATSIALLLLSVQRASRLASQQVEFVAAVSHELQTPLAVIRSAGENLADGLVTGHDQVKRYGALVKNEGLRLSSMVEQVLAFAGMRGERRLHVRPARVGDVVRQAVDSASADLNEAGMAVEIEVPDDLPLVPLDADAVVRALANLLTNAAKYAREGGVVRITAEQARARKGEELRISVIDRGPGIDPEDQPHIFEPFYRARTVIASRIHGTGLGLSLVEAIASAHGGRVSVEPGQPRGSTFTLHLPFVPVDEKVPAGQAVTADRS